MLEFTPVLFLYQLGAFIVFAVLVTIIYKTLLAPVLRERRERIEGDMARAAAAREEADEFKSKYESRMAAVGEETSAILKRVNEEAARHRQELLEQTRRQADALLRQAEELVASQETQAKNRLRAEMAEIAARVAAYVLGETRTAERERKLAEEFLADLSARGAFERRLDA